MQHLTVSRQIWYNCFENVALCNELKANTNLSYKQAGMLVGNFEKNNKELPKIRFCGRALKCHSPLKRYQFTRTKHYLLSYVFFFRVRILKRTELKGISSTIVLFLWEYTPSLKLKANTSY